MSVYQLIFVPETPLKIDLITDQIEKVFKNVELDCDFNECTESEKLFTFS